MSNSPTCTSTPAVTAMPCQPVPYEGLFQEAHYTDGQPYTQESEDVQDVGTSALRITA